MFDLILFNFRELVCERFPTGEAEFRQGQRPCYMVSKKGMPQAYYINSDMLYIPNANSVVSFDRFCSAMMADIKQTIQTFVVNLVCE